MTHISTVAIIKDITNQKSFEDWLSRGHFIFRKNEISHSYFITNISINELKYLSAQYNRLSFVFGYIEDNDSIKSEYWETNSPNKITPESYLKKDNQVEELLLSNINLLKSIEDEYISFYISDEKMISIKNDIRNNLVGSYLWRNRAQFFKKQN